MYRCWWTLHRTVLLNSFETFHIQKILVKEKIISVSFNIITYKNIPCYIFLPCSTMIAKRFSASIAMFCQYYIFTFLRTVLSQVFFQRPYNKKNSASCTKMNNAFAPVITRRNYIGNIPNELQQWENKKQSVRCYPWGTEKKKHVFFFFSYIYTFLTFFSSPLIKILPL